MRLSPDSHGLEAAAARERLPRESLAVLGPDHHIPLAGVRLVWLEPIADTSGGRSIREQALEPTHCRTPRDRKSTRLNSSHGYNSYAVFCLEKKKRVILGQHCTVQVPP